MADILVAGMATADIVMRVTGLPQHAEKYRAAEAAIMVGGCAANAALAIARHGGRARLAARFGDDAMGDMALSALAREGIDTSLSSREQGARSAFSTIAVDAAGERQIVNFRGSGLAEISGFPDTARAAAVLADNRNPALAVAAMAAARAWKVPGVLDVEAPFVAEAAEGASHLAFSMQGLRDYAPDMTVEAALRRARAEFGAWVAVTDGAGGVYFLGGKDGAGAGEISVGHVPAFAVTAVDTLGAGDIWHGVFTLGLAEGMEARGAIRFANAAAALKCLSFGGGAACPDRAATEAFLKERDQCI